MTARAADLASALYSGDAAAALALVRAGAPPIGATTEGVPLILRAAETGSVRLVSAMLAAGADVSTTVSGFTIWGFAAAAPRPARMVRYLLRVGVLPAQPEAMELLCGPFPLCVKRAVLASGADVNARDREGAMALHYAAAGGRSVSVKPSPHSNLSPACGRTAGGVRQASDMLRPAV
jgi:ankyrin repeat protein